MSPVGKPAGLPPHWWNMYYHCIISTKPDCDSCPLKRKRKVFPNGPVPADVAIVGEAPGKNEVRKGIGFAGDSGDVLWNQIGPHVGLRRETSWVSNAILCRPDKVKLASGAWLPEETVKRLALQCCQRRLIDELRIVKPKVIIPVGSWALRGLGLYGAKASVYAYRGSVQPVDLDELATKI